MGWMTDFYLKPEPDLDHFAVVLAAGPREDGAAPRLEHARDRVMGHNGSKHCPKTGPSLGPPRTARCCMLNEVPHH